MTGLSLLPSAPFFGNVDGAQDIFGATGHVWATTMHLTPMLKWPCIVLWHDEDAMACVDICIQLIKTFYYT